PGPLPEFGRPLGWWSWLAAGAAAAWTIGFLAPRGMLHVAAVTGVGIGILAASGMAAGDPSGWTPYHVLTLAWALLGVVLVTFSWVGTAATALGPGLWDQDRRARAADTWRQWFPPGPTRRWVELLSAAVVVLALGGAWGDPGLPYWSSTATLSVAVLLGAVA